MKSLLEKWLWWESSRNNRRIWARLGDPVVANSGSKAIGKYTVDSLSRPKFAIQRGTKFCNENCRAKFSIYHRYVGAGIKDLLYITIMSGLRYRVFYISPLCPGWGQGFSIYHHYVRAGIKDFLYITIMSGLWSRILYISPLCRGWDQGFSIYHHYVGAGIKDFFIYHHYVGAGIKDFLYITIMLGLW